MTSPDLPTLIHAELPKHAWHMIYLRYVCAAGIALGTVALVYGMGATLDPVPLYAVAAALLTTNLLYSLHLSRAVHASGFVSPQAAARSLMLQLSMDLFLLTLLVHFSGGVSNPLMALYGVPILVSGFLLSVRATYVMMAFAGGLYGGMALLEYRQLIPHVPVSGLFSPTAYRSEAYLLVVLVVFGIAILLTAVVSVMVSGRAKMQAAETEDMLEEEFISR